MTASRNVLLGMVPVLIQTPPTTARRSTTATCFPNFAAWMAARCPAGPEPITTRSKSYSVIAAPNSKRKKYFLPPTKKKKKKKTKKKKIKITKKKKKDPQKGGGGGGRPPPRHP